MESALALPKNAGRIATFPRIPARDERRTGFPVRAAVIDIVQLARIPKFVISLDALRNAALARGAVDGIRVVDARCHTCGTARTAVVVVGCIIDARSVAVRQRKFARILADTVRTEFILGTRFALRTATLVCVLYASVVVEVETGLAFRNDAFFGEALAVGPSRDLLGALGVVVAAGGFRIALAGIVIDVVIGLAFQYDALGVATSDVLRIRDVARRIASTAVRGFGFGVHACAVAFGILIAAGTGAVVA